MLLKCHINTNTDKNGFLLSTKYYEMVLKYSYLVSIILNCQFPLFATFLCWSWILIALAHTLISSAHTLIALAHTLIALALTLIALSRFKHWEAAPTPECQTKI